MQQETDSSEAPSSLPPFFSGWLPGHPLPLSEESALLYSQCEYLHHETPAALPPPLSLHRRLNDCSENKKPTATVKLSKLVKSNNYTLSKWQCQCWGEIHLRTTNPQAANYLDRFQSLLSSPSAVIKQLKNIPPAALLAMLRQFFGLGFGSAVSKAKENIIQGENGKWQSLLNWRWEINCLMLKNYWVSANAANAFFFPRKNSVNSRDIVGFMYS